jgi:Flp pilus assembly protein TadD
VLVQVQDAGKHPIRGLEIGIDGRGGSRITGDDGKAALPIGNTTKEGDWLSLAILHAPAGKDFVMISPWDSRAQVPSFEDKPENFIRVVVVQRGDRAALESGTVMTSLVAKLNIDNSTRSAETPANPKANLVALATQYGLSPEDVDQAIRAWGAKTTDPYDAGLAALYERDYPKASAQLQDSLQQRELKLTADTKSVLQERQQVADTAFFLGASLYEQARYLESARAYQECLRIRNNDVVVMNNLALSLHKAGDFAAAEPLYRNVIQIVEKLGGPDDLPLAMSLNNLAVLRKDKGDYSEAESLYRRSLGIRERILGPDDPRVATTLQPSRPVGRQR